MITIERLKELLSYDKTTGDFTRLKQRQRYKIGEIAGYLNADGYILIEIDGKAYFAHRLAWFYEYGKWPENEIDHKDTVKTNNRIDNLRECDHTRNLQNTNVYSNNLLGIKGVRKKGNKFEVRIRVNKKLIYLGLHKDIESASKAYENAAKFYFDKFARS